MISLNDHLYEGLTVPQILRRYEQALRREAEQTGDPVGLEHCAFLMRLCRLTEHDEIAASQAARLRAFYTYMEACMPELSFTFKGRIKSLVRAEAKFNGYVVSCIHEYYRKEGCPPPFPLVKKKLDSLRDLIAWRMVISLPKGHVPAGRDREEEELRYLYQIAEELPLFMRDHGFRPEPAMGGPKGETPLSPQVRGWYRDYVASPKSVGYRSLHISFYDEQADCQAELQLRTKAMDDDAKIGPAEHLGYEQRQLEERARRGMMPVGLSPAFDAAWERGWQLQQIDPTEVDVDMFTSYGPNEVNDSCGLFQGRAVCPYEHMGMM